MEIARELFFRHGIEGTEMKDIALRCGIGRTSLYRYYDSKESLALEIAGGVIRDFYETAIQGAAVEELSGFEAVKSILTAYQQVLCANTDKVRFLDNFDVYFQDSYPNTPAAGEYVAYNQQPPRVLIETLRRGVEDGSVRLRRDEAFTSRYMINALLGVAMRVLPRAALLHHEEGYSVEYLQQTLELLLMWIDAQG